MKRLVYLWAGVILTGCASSPSDYYVTKGGTQIYTSTDSQKGLVTTVDPQRAAVASPHGEIGSERGASTRHRVLGGLVTWGNYGAGTAAQNGNIQEVDSVQEGGTSVLWGLIYSGRSTIVTGGGGTGGTFKK